MLQGLSADSYLQFIANAVISFAQQYPAQIWHQETPFVLAFAGEVHLMIQQLVAASADAAYQLGLSRLIHLNFRMPEPLNASFFPVS